MARFLTLLLFLTALVLPGLTPAHCAPPPAPEMSAGHHGDHGQHHAPAKAPEKVKHDCIGCALRFAAPLRPAMPEKLTAVPEAAIPAPLHGLLSLPEPRPPRA